MAEVDINCHAGLRVTTGQTGLQGAFILRTGLVALIRRFCVKEALAGNQRTIAHKLASGD
jgi:hypothetical protein